MTKKGKKWAKIDQKWLKMIKNGQFLVLIIPCIYNKQFFPPTNQEDALSNPYIKIVFLMFLLVMCFY